MNFIFPFLYIYEMTCFININLFFGNYLKKYFSTETEGSIIEIYELFFQRLK